ncbi:uncharacterized protein STEHIDRAFT_145826 [Stereum hirsutum FP-91666 SS1]|uniref:uncharacterized protein n=1 Tax=Stereum hirsutum (strain FP-91666) TaxID=721885 RepID=UPI000440CC9D|nr:uncharacterized protein STEHIDRAFT_145826 [Stereum hirsutum FP-91666 SS1]EIM89088.1 hypothetical protein STEHIDRAFT_145826 [Stereum hirsutum FP-91666 SS1]
MMFFISCLDHLTVVADRVEVNRVCEPEVFLTTCIRGNIFEALLGVLINKGDVIKGLPYLVCHLLNYLPILVEAAPSVLHLLRPRFPQNLLLRTCLVLAFDPSPLLQEWALDNTSNVFATCEIRRGWISVNALNELARMDRQCARAGCKKRRRVRCKACRTAEYCGYECQVKDWQDHRAICGFREAPGMVRELYPPECSEPENLVRPERMPFRFDMLDD